ncbi:MAG: hypothetical protein OHK0039_17040 [Bacteroidia bacterium]
MQAYTPIDCSFYDELEALATRRRTCAIAYEDDQGSEQTIEARIQDLRAEQGIEYLLTDSGLKLRLDRLRSVDGKVPRPFC